MARDPSADMTIGDPAERLSLSFVIRIWLELPEPGRGVAWRGHITQVPSGEQRSFDDLDEAALFVLRHLERLGAQTPLRWRVRRWLARRRGAGRGG
jgi:hypothetical protein